MSEDVKRVSEGKPHWVKSLKNTSGELEQETLSRKENLIEAFFTITLVLVTLWLMAYPAVLLGIGWLNILAIAMLAIGAIILILVMPFVHKDEFSGWGLGNPKALVDNIRRAEKPKKVLLLAIVFFLIVGLTSAVYIFWIEVADFLGINETTAMNVQNNAGGSALIIGVGAIVAVLFATVLIRYDNFLSALLTAFKIIVPLALLMLGFAFLLMGTAAFSDFNAASFGLNFFGYIFWGAIQQLLFSSYFGTRIRKGFGPAKNPEKQKRKRFLVSVLNGSFFGLLHIPSWGLLAVTWFLGVFLSWVFMEDKNRNLIALGVIHGFLGSMLGWLFSSNKAGSMEIEMSVGPWNMDGIFDISVFIVVGILVTGFVAFMLYVYKKWEE